MATGATATVLPVPRILNILSDSDDNYFIDQNVMQPQMRAKKRRLDHLSWEEKIQRKKLKNRVAAQTSRDRKKAKVEQMEMAIQQLFNKNETLEAECQELRETNERLLDENSELQERLRRLAATCTADLLDELECESVDLNALEQLTQTLLEDIARDLEGAAETTVDQKPIIDRADFADEVVGPPPEHVESDGDQFLEEAKPSTLELDISEYLLLHHNYAKSPPKSPKPATKKLKCIRPNTAGQPAPKKVPVQPAIKREEAEVVYGTFDEDTNTLTILVDEDSVPLNEVIIGESPEEGVLETLSVDTESVPTTTTTTTKAPPCSDECGFSSPRSDLGYESSDSPLSLSLDSPLSGSDLDTTWEQSVSELFPALF